MIDRSRKHSKSDRAKGKKHALRARKNFQKQTRYETYLLHHPADCGLLWEKKRKKISQ